MITELKGAPVSKAVAESIKPRIDKLADKGITPKLAIIRIGASEDDKAYESSIIKKFSALGAAVEVAELPLSVPEEDLISVIKAKNADISVHGILLFRPLPKHLKLDNIKLFIAPEKDVDCMGEINTARVFSGEKDCFPPCTAQAVIEILDFYNIPLTGKKAVVVGRSMVVGRPLSMLLLNKNATVTICHTKTENLPEECLKADILVACAGSAGMIGREYTNPAQTVIDVGINFKDGKLCGDVDFCDVAEHVHSITPVPGGVGTVTTAVLLKHTVISAQRLYNQNH